MGNFIQSKVLNCRNCYKCIRHCSVKSIRFNEGLAEIIDNECILCGECYVVCPQNVRIIKDEIRELKGMLAGEKPVVASLDPSFFARWEGVGFNGMREALKKLGFFDVEETSVGAAIIREEYRKKLDEGNRDVIITSGCHAINLLIQKHYPKVLDKLAPVVSPMQAHGYDIKRRIDKARTVYIGPCAARKDEAASYPGSIDLVLTFDEIHKLLEVYDIVPEPVKDEADSKNKDRCMALSGGIIHGMKDRNTEYTYLTVDSVENCMEALHDIETGEIHHCFIEMGACQGGCSNGPVMRKHKQSAIRNLRLISNEIGEKSLEAKELPEEIRYKKYSAIPKIAEEPEDEQIREILIQMGKMNPSKIYNCGSCGYDTCREKAIAIFQGKAEVSMCLPFLHAKAERFSRSILNNSPNSIILLNEQLEVLQINKAGRKLFQLSDTDTMEGKPFSKLMNDEDCQIAMETQKTIQNKRVYLAQLDKWVEEIIAYDEQYHNVLCILRDVTQEEKQKAKKEDVCRSTIEVADQVVENQMRIVQEIASLLGETTAETKIALTKLKEFVQNE